MKITLIILLLALIFNYGCDIFETRDPEQPNSSRSNFEIPSEPQIVIQNLQNAFSDRNSDNYQKNFASGPPLVNKIFSFLPTSQALSSDPALWASWDVVSEFQYFNNLVTRVPEGLPITLLLSEEQYSPSIDSTIYTAKYFISIPNLTGDPEIYEGSLKFNMITDNQLAWVIHYWEDIAKENSSSWSNLKIENNP